MVTRVDKFLGGLGADVTSVANVHATENRIAFGASMNPTANVHVTGNAHITTTLSTGGNIIGGGTYTGGGTMTTGGNIVIPNDGDIGSVGTTDAIQISSGGIVTFKDDIKIKDGGTIGSASDAAAITIAASGQVTFSDVATFSGGLKVPDDGTIGTATTPGLMQFFDNNLRLVTTSTNDGDSVLQLYSTDTGSGSSPDMFFWRNSTSPAVSDFLGKIIFYGENDASESTIYASLSAQITDPADGTENGRFIFTSKAAGADGSYTLGGDSTGFVFTIPNGSHIGSASDRDAISIGSDGDVTLTQDLELQHDGAIISFGTNDEITLTHVHNTGLLLEDSGGSPTLQLHDSNESVSSDGTNLILTSGGTAFTLPTADGSADQVLKTDGSGALSFTSISSNAITSGDTVVNVIDPNITFVTNGAEEARITADGNLVLGSTTATHLLDVRGTANTGVLTASGLTFPSSDGSANQAMVTDGSGALSFATVLTSRDPSTTLAATPDLGSVASGGSQDAFGQNLGGLTETDLLDEPAGSLATLDAGALS